MRHVSKVKCFECSTRVEACYIRTSPFTIYLYWFQAKKEQAIDMMAALRMLMEKINKVRRSCLWNSSSRERFHSKKTVSQLEFLLVYRLFGIL